MALCTVCQAVPWEFLDRPDPNKYFPKKEILHQKSFQDLKAAANQGCQFCQLIFSVINVKMTLASAKERQSISDRKQISLRQSGNTLGLDGNYWYYIIVTIQQGRNWVFFKTPSLRIAPALICTRATSSSMPVFLPNVMRIQLLTIWKH
jgi:hypothetical protein